MPGRARVLKRPCKGCGKEKKEKPPEDPVIVLEKTNNHVEEPIAHMRLSVCHSCDERVIGDRDAMLARRINGKLYCGDPQDPRTFETPAEFGCGCAVEERTKWAEASCPRGKWGPGKRFGAQMLPIFLETSGDTIPQVLDYIAPARTMDNLTDMTGIGDTMLQGITAQALHKANAEQGIRVRFCTIPQRLEWGRLATANKMEVIDLSDPEREKGQYAAHSSSLKIVELDATCEMRGWSRLELLAQQFQMSLEQVKSWEVDISEEGMLGANDFLKYPKDKGRTIVAVAPFANSHVRTWPFRHFMHLVELLRNEHLAVYLIDRPRPPEDRTLKHIPVRAVQTDDVDLLAGIVKQSDLVITNDSGMAHLAGFVGTKSMAVCGPSKGDIAYGGYDTVTAVQAPGPCTGCLWFKDGGWKPWCGFGCDLMNDLKPRSVLMRALGVLAG